MSLPDNLPHRCTVQRLVPVEDDLGGQLEESEAVSSGVACWVQPASDGEITIFQRRDQRVTHKVYFRGSPGVRPGYQIIPDDGPVMACPFAGALLEVRSAAEATAGTGLLFRVMCEEIQPR